MRVTRKKWVRVVFRRRILVGAVLLVQIGLVLWLIAGGSLMSRYVSLGCNLVSVLVCFRVLNKRNKPAYKLTWIFLIMIFPVFGGLLYVFFYSQSDPRRYRRLIQEARIRCRPLYELDGSSLTLLEGDAAFPQARYLQHYSGYPVYDHTRAEYFCSGETWFKRLLLELKKAQGSIFMEFFIIREGQMLDAILRVLEDKAKEGVDVRIIYDDMGCFMSLPSDYQQQLQQKGIRSLVFNPFKPILSSLQNNRDHRKIVSIDGRVAFTGGINIGDEYLNIVKKYGHWKDAGLMVEGRAAWSLTLIFLEMWGMEQEASRRWFSRFSKNGRATAAGENYAALYPWRESPCTVESAGFVQPYADSPLDRDEVSENAYLQIIHAAKRYLYINTPYFIVDDALLSALTLAAQSGIDVRIITPHIPDKAFAFLVTRSYYRRLIACGVKVYEYTPGFNHAKTMVSDDEVAMVGTANLDYRSLCLHFECGVKLYKSPAIAAARDDFLATVAVSHEVSQEECAGTAVRRLMQDILAVFAPLM
jgi:cardiolipin synthase